MMSRAAVLVVLVVLEAAIVGMGVMAVRGDASVPWTAASPGDGPVTGGLPEGGPARTFAVGPSPSIHVDIGYADLTIQTGKPGEVAVSVSKSNDFGMMRAKAPITAQLDGATVQIVKHHEGFSIGDNRMVTLIVPPATSVNVENAGNIEATGLRGAASFSSAGSGKIRIDDFDGPTLRAETSNGRIVLSRVTAPRVEISSDDGRIEGTSLRLHDGSIESNDGRVSLSFAPGTDTLIAADASDGSVHVDGSTDSPPSKTVRIGAGTGHLDVSAGNGSIRISQDG